MVLGLVTTKHGKLESADGLRDRVHAANRYVPLERLGISPQCGFASSIIGNRISYAEQRQKIELLTAAARIIW